MSRREPAVNVTAKRVHQLAVVEIIFVSVDEVSSGTSLFPLLSRNFEIRLMVFDRRLSERKKRDVFAMFLSCCSIIGNFRRRERERECKIFRCEAFDRFCSILKSIVHVHRNFIGKRVIMVSTEWRP